MKILIVDDDFVSRITLHKLLMNHGFCDMAEDGKEAVAAFEKALEEDAPYDLVCMDIMMPEMDGQEAMQQIRAIEKKRGTAPGKEIKAIMVTALDDPTNVSKAFFRGEATGYIAKPYDHAKIVQMLQEMGLAQEEK